MIMIEYEKYTSFVQDS